MMKTAVLVVAVVVEVVAATATTTQQQERVDNGEHLFAPYPLLPNGWHVIILPIPYSTHEIRYGSSKGKSMNTGIP